MKIGTSIILIVTHLSVGVIGFGLGIYALPILIAPPAPSESEIESMSSSAEYSAEFKKDLKDLLTKLTNHLLFIIIHSKMIFGFDNFKIS